MDLGVKGSSPVGPHFRALLGSRIPVPRRGRDECHFRPIFMRQTTVEATALPIEEMMSPAQAL